MGTDPAPDDVPCAADYLRAVLTGRPAVPGPGELPDARRPLDQPLPVAQYSHNPGCDCGRDCQLRSDRAVVMPLRSSPQARPAGPAAKVSSTLPPCGKHPRSRFSTGTGGVSWSDAGIATVQPGSGWRYYYAWSPDWPGPGRARTRARRRRDRAAGRITPGRRSAPGRRPDRRRPAGGRGQMAVARRTARWPCAASDVRESRCSHALQRTGRVEI